MHVPLSFFLFIYLHDKWQLSVYPSVKQSVLTKMRNLTLHLFPSFHALTLCVFTNKSLLLKIRNSTPHLFRLFHAQPLCLFSKESL